MLIFVSACVLVLVFHLCSYFRQQYNVNKVLSPLGLCSRHPLVANQGTALPNHLPGKSENTMQLNVFACLPKQLCSHLFL